MFMVTIIIFHILAGNLIWVHLFGKANRNLSGDTEHFFSRNIAHNYFDNLLGDTHGHLIGHYREELMSAGIVVGIEKDLLFTDPMGFLIGKIEVLLCRIGIDGK